MNALVNSVQLVGNIGMDPMIKKFENNAVIRFSIAVNEYIKNSQGEKEKKTHWFNIVGWGSSKAAFAEKFLLKGQRIALEGRLVQTEYTNSEGTVVKDTEIVARDFLLM